MKKLILYILLTLSIFGLVSQDSSALSYDGTSVYSFPQVTIGSGNYQSNLAWDRFIGGTTCSAVYSWDSSCKPFPYYYNSSNVASNDVIYYKYDDGILTDTYVNNRFLSIELDFNGITNSGVYLLDYGGFPNYDQNIKFDFYLSGSSLHYRLFYHGDGLFNTISDWSVNITDLPSDWSTIDWGGYFPKRMVLNLEDFLFSQNNLIGADTWIRAVSIQKITSDSKSLTLTYEGNDDPGRKLFNSFSSLGFASRPDSIGEIVDVFSDHSSDFPYVNFSGSTLVSVNQFPQIKFHTFGNLQDVIDNDPSWSGSTAVLNTALGLFYINESTSFTIQSSSSSGNTDNSGIDGNSDTFFSSCTSFLDVGCYIQGAFNGISSKVSSFFSSIWSWLIPDFNINWNGSTQACATFGGSSGSGSTSSGSLTVSSGSGSIGVLQKFANFFSAFSPFPPVSGSTVCLLDGTTKTVNYASSTINFFDILIILLCILPILFASHHDHSKKP